MSTRILALLALTVTFAAAADVPPDFRYKVETFLEGMPQPMQLQFAPDGRIFFIEIAGKVKVLYPDTKKVVEAGSLTVFTDQENGLLGMALVIHAAAREHRRLFQSAQPRRRLARVEDARLPPPDVFHKLRRERRDTGKMLEKIQRDPFRCEDRAHRAFDLDDAVACFHPAAALRNDLRPRLRIDATENLRRRVRSL